MDTESTKSIWESPITCLIYIPHHPESSFVYQEHLCSQNKVHKVVITCAYKMYILHSFSRWMVSIQWGCKKLSLLLGIAVRISVTCTGKAKFPAISSVLSSSSAPFSVRKSGRLKEKNTKRMRQKADCLLGKSNTSFLDRLLLRMQENCGSVKSSWEIK